VIAAFDYLIMFFVALFGGSLLTSPGQITGFLTWLQSADPAAHATMMNALTEAGISLPLIYSFFFVFGYVLAGAGIIGMIVALGTAYKKWWAIPVGLWVSVLCIVASFASYFLDILFPGVTTVGLWQVMFKVLNIFFVVLAVNVFFVGAFLIWQLGDLKGKSLNIGRLILIWNLNVVCLIWTAFLLPGIEIGIPGTDILTRLGITYLTVALLAVINLLIRPLVTKLVTQAARWWLGFAISFVLIIIVNTFILYYLQIFLPDFSVVFLLDAFLGSLLLSAVNTIFLSAVGIDEDSSFFQSIVRWRLKAKAGMKGVPKTPGLVAIEIDGLGYAALQEALRREYMPTIQKLLDSGTHKVIQWDCGIPSMTSSCQAGILHGNNDDIPAFRWFVKEEKRMVVSNSPSDAKFIDDRASSGKGLLTNGGSSVGNLLSGDASFSFFTMSTLTKEDSKAGRRRSEDLYYYLLDPYALNRSMIHTIWDLFVEIGQIIKQTITRRKPRMNRLAHGYPLVRAATNVFMRDVVTAMVSQDILRGSPAIYATYLGYDEIAHHSGPMSTDALKSLRGIDKQLRRLLRIINLHAPRPYELFLLADHGQSWGWTFLQRYDFTLKEFISELLVGKAKVGEVKALDAHDGYVAGLSEDIAEGHRRAIGGAEENGLRQPPGLFKRETEAIKMGSAVDIEDADVVVCASGNLAQVYFTHQVKRVTRQNLEKRYPGFIDQLVAHEGIGIVIVNEGRNEGPVLLGKGGSIKLRTGRVKGENPLTQYGREKIRVEQLRRLAEFKNSGGLIIISPVYEDGTVAAYEELIGNHGGLGGPQTEPFLLHPVAIKVDGDSIINSDQIYPILRRQRPKS
jgi:hypothetical protein